MASPSPSQPNSQPIADQILRAIRRILRKTAEHSRQVTRDGGLSVPQLLCLRNIAESTRNNRVTVARVAEAVQLSMPTVSRIVDRLEAAELIVRERSTDDRRKVYLKVTPKGRRRVKKLPTPLHDQLLARLSSAPAEKQQSLLAALEEIVGMMGAEKLDAAPMLMPGTDAKPDEGVKEK